MEAESRSAAPSTRILSGLVLTGLALAFLTVVVINAWLSDDAYITFRTVDNFIHGHGLTWNVSERVQAYTHPLWMFLLSGANAITGDIYFTSLLLSIVISFAAVLLLAFRHARSCRLAGLTLIVFTLSKAFIDYATSGLENPLTHLLLMGFVAVYAGGRVTPRRFFWLSLLAALGMLNRPDTAVLYGPALLWALIETRSAQSFLAGLLGALPLVAWEAFSVLYYGSWVPNTALAKLNAGLIQPVEIWREGLFYLENSLRVDPITLVTVGLGLVAPLLARDWRKLALSAGLALYLAYVVRVGGDFMSGRFLTAPLFLAVALLAGTAWSSRLSRGRHPLWLPELALTVTLATVGLSASYNPIRAWGSTNARSNEQVWVSGRSITDERATYYQNTSLLRALTEGVVLPDHDWAIAGREAREAGPAVVVKGSVGFFGYFAGPEVHVVDLLALGDPLLARLPVTDPNWQVGHFGRRPPEGYMATLTEGRNRLVNPGLARYYDHLAAVTRDDLWRPGRVGQAWALATGEYDSLLDAYAYHRGELFSLDFVATNPTHHPYVYAYVWNNGAGEAYLIDDASSRGRNYPLTWSVSASGVQFSGTYLQQVSSIGALSDRELLTVGVFFAPDASLTTYEMYERRYWFQLGAGEDAWITVVLPGLEWYNAEAPGGFWRERDIDPVVAMQP